MRITGKDGFLNPYIAGFLLGIVLLGSFVILGTGPGASGGVAVIADRASSMVYRIHSLMGNYFGTWGDMPLNYYLVFMLAGIFIGSLASSLMSGRFCFEVERGHKCSAIVRLAFAFGGGIIVGFAGRLTRGCTTGHALSGCSLLLAGSFLFLLCVLIGGFVTAGLFRRQWDD